MKTVVIIIGSGRSGSTLLAKALGGHSNCFALGEINRFNNEINNKETHCGCGNKLNECYFWSKVRSDLEIGKQLNSTNETNHFDVGIFRQLTRKSIHKLIPTVLFERKYKNSSMSIVIQNTFILYNKLFQESNSSVLVDSSKNLFRALVLASRSPKDIQFKFLHLVRDGRGVLNSSLKSSYNILHLDGIKRVYKGKVDKDPIKIINKWLYINIRNFLILKIFRKKKTFFLRYEDFVSNPANYLKNIYDWINLNFQESALQLDRSENHILGGNSSRINAKEIKKQDDTWKSNLDEKILSKFNKRAGWFNKIIGY